MEIPSLLKTNLSIITSEYKMSDLKLALSNITTRYMDDYRDGSSLLNKDIEAVSYANVRMAATYGSVYNIIEHLLNNINYEDIPRSILDVGAGTGSASWAIAEQINLDNILCLEREDAMLKLGEKLMDENFSCNNVKWQKFDVLNNKITDKKDLVIASYMINELNDDIKDEVIDELWNSANKFLVIVEPGTKMGFNNIKKIRERLLSKGANIVLPCPCDECKISEDDWCHFTIRVARTKIHKELKEADVPYEDEKFSYIVLSKIKTDKCNMRVMRHPIIETGKVTLTVCSKDGVSEKCFRKKDDEFKIAKKLNCGDSL
ncbi:MAG: small ribosomal subunit Rsm22 family protein [Clostridia bacterium]|nr:small ribosomal subunit Rsm22 family protein [Clostridia bacterium]